MRSQQAFGTLGTLGLIVNVPIRDPAIPNPLATGKEDGCFQPYLTVLRDPEAGRFRLWYGVHTADFHTGKSHFGAGTR